MCATDAAPSPAACWHCALPVPDVRHDPEGTPRFCCAGCHAAWSILHELGLGRYYRLAERRGTAVASSGHSFEQFDHASFQTHYVTHAADGLATTELYLEGVHCTSCVWLVERVPLTLDGVVEARLDVAHRRVHLVWDERHTSLSSIAKLLDQLGYRAHSCRGRDAARRRRSEDRGLLIGIGVAAALAINVMILALALYSGWFSGMDRDTERYFRWMSLMLTAPALLWPGRVFFRSAWAALRARTLHMDLPIAVALGAGFSRGTINTITDRGPIYFDGVTALIFLLLVGRFLQQRAYRAAVDSAELLHALTPASARVIEDAVTRHVPVEALVPGMSLEVLAGDTVAADGLVVDGDSEIDLSLLTGESRPQRVTTGSQVWAGTLNRNARLVVRIERTREQSRVGRMLQEVELAAQRRAPIVHTADRLAGRFVGVVFALAVITYAVWRTIDPAAALDNAIALLIVTCPCALALATPLAMTVAIGRAARMGILIKGSNAIEALSRPSTLVLDKTGTLTEGRSTLVSWSGSDDLKPLVAALERHASHPLARGFLDAWRPLPNLQATSVVSVPGCGITGVVAGRRVAVGTRTFAGASNPGALHDAGSGAHTPAWVAVDGRIEGVAWFADSIRPDAPATLARLRARGFHLRLLSGDSPEVVDAIGRELGFAAADRRGGATPESKLRAIEGLAEQGTVVMVGDGVNDAAAIARASVGIGVRGGAEASLAAADVFITTPGLAGLADLVDGSTRTLGVIRWALGVSLMYNLLGATLAMAGVINPLIAAIMMPVSSLTVVLIAWLGRSFEHATHPAPGHSPVHGAWTSTVTASEAGEAA